MCSMTSVVNIVMFGILHDQHWLMSFNIHQSEKSPENSQNIPREKNSKTKENSSCGSTICGTIPMASSMRKESRAPHHTVSN